MGPRLVKAVWGRDYCSLSFIMVQCSKRHSILFAISLTSAVITIIGCYIEGGISMTLQTNALLNNCLRQCQCDSNIYISTNTTPPLHKGLVPLDSLKNKKPLLGQVTKVKGLAYLDNLSLSRFYKCLPSTKNKLLKDKTQEVSCYKQMTFLQRSSPIVALASFQGSGNTWVRHLLEQATGVYTGSVYCDETLKAVFPGEYIVSSNVLIVKTHHPDTANLPPEMVQTLKQTSFDKAIVIVRNPFDSLVSEWNRRWNKLSKYESHLGIAKESAFIGNPTWDWYVEYKGMSWLVLLNVWLKESHLPHIVVQFENLQTNLTTELTRMLEFLEMPISQEMMNCVLNNKEGLFKRKQHLNFDPFSSENKQAVNRIIEQAQPLLNKYGIHYNTR